MKREKILLIALFIILVLLVVIVVYKFVITGNATSSYWPTYGGVSSISFSDRRDCYFVYKGDSEAYQNCLNDKIANGRYCVDSDESDTSNKGSVLFFYNECGADFERLANPIDCSFSLSFVDFCVNARTVREYKCNRDGSVKESNVNCTKGCLDGACLT